MGLIKSALVQRKLLIFIFLLALGCSSKSLSPTASYPDIQNSNFVARSMASTTTYKPSYLSELYLLVLNREADAGGEKSWASTISSGQQTYASLVDAFVYSEEFKNKYASYSNQDFIVFSFQHVLGRKPEPTGLNYWLNILNTSQDKAGFYKKVVLSEESKNRNYFLKLSQVGFLYDLVFKRLPDAAGEKYWTQEIAAKRQNLHSLIDVFTNSAEFNNLYSGLTSSQYVTSLYQNVLHRSADNSEIQYWAGTLTTKTRQELFKVFALSEESKIKNPWLFVNVNPIVIDPGIDPNNPYFVEYDINGQAIPNPTADQTILPRCEFYGNPKSPGTGVGPCGSAKIPIGTCGSGMNGSVLHAYQYNSNPVEAGNGLRIALPIDAAFVVRFTTPKVENLRRDASGNYNHYLGFTFEEQVNRGPAVSKFAVVSENKCDFDYQKLNNPADRRCRFIDGVGGGITMKVTPSPSSTDTSCQLLPNKTYFFSLRHEDVTRARGINSCAAFMSSMGISSPTCGLTLQIP